MSAPTLRCHGLVVRFGTIGVLNSLDLSLNGGEVLGVLGANGAGKSTLLKAIMGAVGVSGGTITFDGVDITKLSVVERVRRGVVLIPQGRRIFPTLSVRDNVRLGAFTFRKDHARVAAALERQTHIFPTLEKYWLRPAGTLSGGQQQLVAVARGLMPDPKVLMLDEPSLGVTPDILESVRTAAHTLARERQTSVVIVEQNVSFALAATERIAFLRSGIVLYEEKTPVLRANPSQLMRLYLGVEAGEPAASASGESRERDS